MMHNKNLLMIMRGLFRSLYLFLVLGLFSFCIDFTKESPEKRTFIIETKDIGRSEKTISAKMKVKPTLMSARFQGKSLVYKIAEGEYQADFYNELFTTPSANLSHEIKKLVEKNGIISLTLDAQSRLDADYSLETSVDEMYGDYSTDKPQAILQIQFLILRQADDAILYNRTFISKVDVAGKEPNALIAGFAKALEEAVQSFCGDLATKTDKFAEAPKTDS